MTDTLTKSTTAASEAPWRTSTTSVEPGGSS